jgi:hypothetical protein
MTNWITDDHDNQIFFHEGWTVRIWSPECKWNRIEVNSPHAGEEVEVTEEGIWVKGESSGGWEGPSPSAFTIPWEVIAAIAAARQIVAEE